MSRNDYISVLEHMRLKSGYIFPIPITLAVDNVKAIQMDKPVSLRDQYNNILAVLTVKEIYERRHEQEAMSVCGTLDTTHPLVSEMTQWGRYYVSGDLRVIQLPRYFDYLEIRNTPEEVRQKLELMGYRNVVAFQTRNPMHRAHEELTKKAADNIGGALLLHPVVGITKSDDVDYFTRVMVYKALFDKYYDHTRTLLSLLPLAMRMAGPREAVWHAIIRRNYGADHLIVGRDHASPGNNAKGKPFYEPYAAQTLLAKFSKDIGVKMIPFQELVYLPEEDRYKEIGHVPEGTKYFRISGAAIRKSLLHASSKLPSWMFRPETRSILDQIYSTHPHRGFCVWFTGLPGSGKSTIAEELKAIIQKIGREVTVLDGDIIRAHLSKELGFSYKDRNTHLQRVGYVASEIVKHNGIVICATVSPYQSIRDYVRTMVGADRFILIYVNTPLSLCEKRDQKGFFVRARRANIKHFTGVDDTYEIPPSPDVTLSTTHAGSEINAKKILRYLHRKQFLT